MHAATGENQHVDNEAPLAIVWSRGALLCSPTSAIWGTVPVVTDSMDSPAAIMGRFSGGPLDGLTFALPRSSRLKGATLVALLADHDQDEIRRHVYEFVPLGVTNEMQYRGEAASA